MPDLLHQLGWRYNWSVDALGKDQAGTGVIAAPRYMAPGKVGQLPVAVRRRSFFDPQFFLPHSTKGSLTEYDFFPNVVANGFSTSGYDGALAASSAEACVRFQTDHQFKYCVIPTRLREGAPSDYIESQEVLFVEPFRAACAALGTRTPLLLQLILTEHMLKDPQFTAAILNWVTGIEEIAGVYLIPYVVARRRKQVYDTDLLLGLLDFVTALRANNLDVVVGYLNTEAIPLLVADPTAITMGSYENLRMFSPKPFDSDDESQARGPNARIYAPKLLQWVDNNYLGAIRRVTGTLDGLLDVTPYNVSMFKPDYNWHFTKSEPYKHYFVAFARQVQRLSSAPDGATRMMAVLAECQGAVQEYKRLDAGGIEFDQDSGGGHLPLWVTVLKQYGRRRGWLP